MHQPNNLQAAAQAAAQAPQSLAFKGFADWVEVFRAGTQTDSAGGKHRFSEAQLDSIVAQHQPNTAPLVVGHPKTDSPAYGWVSALKRDGAALYAKFDQVHPAMVAAHHSGTYKHRSVKLTKATNGDYRLAHVGVLGAAPPAVEGMALVYSAAASSNASGDANAEGFTFSSADWATLGAFEHVLSMFRGMREYVLGKDGADAADTVAPNWRLDSVAEMAQRIRQAELDEAKPDETKQAMQNPLLYSQHSKHPIHTNPQTNPQDNPMTQAEIDTQLAAAKAEGLAAGKQAAAAEFAAEKTALTFAARLGEAAAQVAAFKAAGVVVPATAVGMPEFMASLDNSTEFEFTAAGAAAGSAQAAPVKQSQSAWFATFMAAQAPLMELNKKLPPDTTKPTGAAPSSAFNAPDGSTVDPDRLVLHELAQEYAAEKGVPYVVAVQAVEAVQAAIKL